MKTLKTLVGVVAIMTAGAAFAGGAQSKHKEKQQAKACEDLNQFKASVAAYDQLGPDSTVKEYRKHSETVSRDFDRFVKSARKYAKPQVENVKESVDQLRKDARKIPQDATMADAREQLRGDIEQVEMASNQLMQKLDCGIGGAGSEVEPWKQPAETGEPATGGAGQQQIEPQPQGPQEQTQQP